MACAYIVLVLLLIVKMSSCSEPKCSSFDYDKQLLERMIEREFEFRQIRDEIKQTRADVNQDVKDLKSDRNIIKQEIIEFKNIQTNTADNKLLENDNKLNACLDELRNDRSNMQFDITEYKKEISEKLDAKESKLEEVFKQQQAVINRMSADLQQLKNETLHEIKVAAVQPAVSFRTSSTSGFTLPRSNAPIIFQAVDFNIGNAYNGKTGVFTTPISGTYLFTIHVCVSSSSYFPNVQIVVDDVHVTRSINAPQSANECFTITDLINPNAGARVWIIHNKNFTSPTLKHDSNRQSYFTGTLI